ncbi:MAG: sigma-70 family RNA polymerase sigma factor [Acidimicrobiales bacterium]
MERDTIAPRPPTDSRLDGVWRANRGYLVGMASRMLADPAEAEDVVQEAFGRLARVDLDDIDDVRGWLAVVVRRLCLDRIRSAHARRVSVAGLAFADGALEAPGDGTKDPAERVTLDEWVQLALTIVLDRLTPAERTAFVLHDVFGYPFAAVGEIVGRTPTACRQLASRARRSIRAGAQPVPPEAEPTEGRILAERFVAACAGGDMDELLAVLDPDIVGEVMVLGRGPLVRVEGRAAVAQRALRFLGPDNDWVLVPVPLEHEPGIIAFAQGRVRALMRLEVSNGRVRHISSFLRR